MERSLARVYYYFVFNAMLILAAVGLGILLNQVLRYTPLNDGGSLPTDANITTAVVYAAVFWLIAGILGGIHYFLLRRDLATDPGAGAGGVRSFFLNGQEFEAGWLGVLFATIGLSFVGTPPPTPSPYASPNYTYISPSVPWLSAAVAVYFIVVLLELERRRTQTAPGAPIVFQRLHFYAIQLTVLIYVMVTLAIALGTTLRATVFASSFNTCVSPGASDCASINLLGPWLAGSFCVALFGVYWLLSRSDTGSTLRQVQQLLGLAAGGLATASGLSSLFALILSALLGAPRENGALEQALTFIIPLLVSGVSAAAVYGLWLRWERGVSRMGARATDLSIAAVAAAVGAYFFWTGINAILVRLAEIVSNPTFQSHTYDWAGPVASVLAGAIYIPVSLYMRALTARTGENGPRRAFVLALLASGILTTAVGGGIALVTTLTAALGQPIDTSGEATRFGVALLLTGLALAALYGWSAVSEHLFGRRSPASAPQSPQGQPAPQAAATVEGVLGELLEGKLSPQEAATRVREAVRAGR